ncbi:ORF6C domain-containing protein [Staphylococcus pseudintermedius]|uniref:BRO family protein n=1 Tax=Staphylococcus pseudintermedius TaxID=283734 RepID=UPI000C1C41F3|nr:ORF6C domain-containing protein [Staphylococcus pseudintermedius]EGQ1605637.1 phage repressor protein [Staphylococcus pseudintermedius]EGQ2711297.1 phage repressor protein [Staphylococcus pseudintermedius]EGQ2757759.1 phage repressor protein [Staphylococcus pseudintermedius]EGQ3454783.1 phage repressor protein [Staphylococcus pseudintermedius]EGQ3546496.1 phage repressor protein [Staphylococcus pseudintermedius]
MQDLQTFSNDMFSILIKQDNENNLFDLETVAKSLGFTQIKNGKQYIRWETINKYLGKYLSQEVGKGDFIPEPMVYKLAFKAGNSTAEKFQDWLAMEVLPEIRQTGIYQVPSDPMQALELMFKATKQTKEEIESVKADVIDLKDNQKLDAGEYGLVTKTIHQRVAYIRQIHGLPNSKEVNKPLYQNINNDVNTMAGIKTRTQLRQKHFNDVMEIITNWFPSQSTMYVIRQLEMDFEEGGK